MTIPDCPVGGVLVLSIDLEADRHEREFVRQQQLQNVAGQLVELLARYDLPATWAIADPAISTVTGRILKSNPDHEIAVLGDPTWLGSVAGRGPFARQLARRVAGARAAGLQISTLVSCGVEVNDHLDLLVKHGITAVRGDVAPARHSARLRPPRAIRFGVWDVPAGCCLPGPSRLFSSGGGTRAARHVIRQAISQTAIAHLAIDGANLDRRQSSALRALEYVLRHAARLQRQGALSIETLSSTAARLSRPRFASPARSILRAAA